MLIKKEHEFVEDIPETLSLPETRSFDSTNENSPMHASRDGDSSCPKGQSH